MFPIVFSSSSFNVGICDNIFGLLTLSVTHLSGEIFELKAELNNEKKEKRKEAVKKVIAAMTVGKDVRYLFKFKLL